MEKEFDNMQNDPFLDAFRNKLSNHSMPVDSGVWKEVEKAVGPKAKRLPLWLVWSLSSAAALALAITVGSFFFNPQFKTSETEFAANSPKADESLSEKQSVQITDSMINHATSEKADQQSTALAETITANRKNTSANRKTEPANSKTEPPVVAKSDTSNPVKENILTTENLQITASETAEVKADENNDPALATITPATSTVQETTTEQKVKQTEFLQIAQASKDWTEEILKKKEDLMQVGIGVGSGLGGASALSFGRNMDFMSEKLATAETAMANIMAPEDFPDKNYLPPVSVGLLFRLKTAKNISFESGLVYSYLLTTMSRENSWSDARAELNLHYVGIPLNVVLNLFNEGKWSIYGSAGIMAEKGLWSYYKQEVYQGPATITTTASKSIDGMQWSLNATLGLSYEVSPDVSLFFDPKLSWYMDNNQPFSVRTHMPLLVGIQAGVRTHF